MEIALQILDRRRQSLALSGFDFTAALAQLRPYPRELDGFVHRFLGVTSDANSFAEHTVLVDLEAALLTHAADGDVVCFGPGEVDHCSAEARLGQAAQIDLQAR